jgi:hypothetical protein
MPELWWQTRNSQAFAEAKQNLLSDSNVKRVSERDYSISGCPAYSLVVGRHGNKTVFQRIDYFLMKPDLHVVMSVSPNDAALNDTACKKLFESVSIKPKTPQ